MGNSGKLSFGRILTVGAILCFGIALILGFFLFQGSSDGEPVEIVIPSGMPLNKIVTLLNDEGVVQQKTFFKYLVRATQGKNYVRAGEFAFRKEMRPLDALRTLYFSDPIVHQVTIPEGWTIRQIAQILAAKKLVKPERFIQVAFSPETVKKYRLSTPSMEGFLFPDTYTFSKVDSEEKIVESMFNRFMQKYLRYGKEAEIKGYTMERLVNLASIVEKETGAPAERPVIASVFLNRLKKGMRLQSDPTTIYGIENFDGNLTKKHLLTETPYNTYKIPALPLGPISNPGEEALVAVLRPAQTQYLYFVSNNNGTHTFTKTYGEHAQFVDVLQKKKGSRRVPTQTLKEVK